MRHIAAVLVLSVILGMTHTGPVTGADDEKTGGFVSPEDQIKASKEKQDKLVSMVIEALEGFQEGRTESADAEEKLWRKPLKELMAELKEPGKSWQEAFAKDYAKAIVMTAVKEPNKFADMLGDAAGGDYKKLTDEVPKIAGTVFGKMVSDALGHFKYEQTKQVWDLLVSNAKDLQKLGKSFMRGDWNQLVKDLRDSGTEKLKSVSKDAIKEMVAWVFEPLGEKAAAGIGAAYVGALEAEAAFIEWGKKTLDRQTTGECLTRYVNTFNQVTAQGAPHAQEPAYDEFKACSEERGKAVGFRALEDFIHDAGLDSDTIYREMAEGYRLNRFYFADEWLAEKLEARKTEVENPAIAELQKVKKDMDEVRARFNAHLTMTILGARAELLGEDALKKLDAAAAKALSDAQREIALIQRAYGGALHACGDFDSALKEAEAVIKSAEDQDEQAITLGSRIENFTGCGDAAGGGQVKGLRDRGQTVYADLTREAGAADTAATAACRAREGIATAASLDAGKQLLDEAARQTKTARDAATKAEAAYRDLVELARQANEINLGGGAGARAELEKLIAEAKVMQDGVPDMKERYDTAHAAMSAALKTATNLKSFAEERAKLVRAALFPYLSSSLRPQLLKVQEDLDRWVQEMGTCRLTADEAWTKGVDGAASWKSREVRTPEIDKLSDRITAANAKCPALAPGAEDPGQMRSSIVEWSTRADTDIFTVRVSLLTADRCVADGVEDLEKLKKGTTTTTAGGAGILKLVAQPQIRPAVSDPYGVNGGSDDRSWSATSGQQTLIRTGPPATRAHLEWSFSGIPDSLTPGQTYKITATGTCNISPDPSFASGVVSGPWLETGGVEVLTHKGAGVGNSPSRGKFIASETAEWEIRVPADATQAHIAIGADFGIGQIAEYNYKAGP
jgi:hypothetical protein